VIVLAIVGVALMLWTRREVESEPPEILAPLVRTTPVVLRSETLRLEAQGTVEPQTESQITAEVAGRVESISDAFAEGAFFDAGEVLLQIDVSDHRVELDRVQATLAVRQAEAAMAERQVSRWRALSERGVASQAELDDAEMRIGVARAAVRAARAELARAELNLERTAIRAPFRGRVRSISVDVGDFVARGAPLARVYGTDFAEIRLPVPSEDIGLLGIGFSFVRQGEEPAPAVDLRATVAGRSAAWTGVVDRLEGEIDRRTRTVGIVVQVEDPFALDNPGEDRAPLTPGLFVRASIDGRTIERAARLPRAAIRPDDRVLVLEEGTRLSFREVEIAQRLAEEVVVSGGLAEGEEVCVSALDAATDGMAVRVFRPEEGAP
jgi:RND family efflux transporter MFP subunit